MGITSFYPTYDYQKIRKYEVYMPIVRIRKRGQVTIPSSCRKDLCLSENDTLNIVKVDDMLILTQIKPFGNGLAGKVETAIRRNKAKR